MRCTQTYGLNNRALKFLDENAKRTLVKICESCGHKEGGNIVKQKSGKTCGMCDEVFLMEYELKDGRIVEEYVQDSLWSSGPMEFYALRYKDTAKIIKESLWTSQEENAVYYEIS